MDAEAYWYSAYYAVGRWIYCSGAGILCEPFLKESVIEGSQPASQYRGGRCNASRHMKEMAQEEAGPWQTHGSGSTGL